MVEYPPAENGSIGDRTRSLKKYSLEWEVLIWAIGVGDKPFLNPSGKWMIAGATVLALGITAVGVHLAIQKLSKPAALST
ncbi:MAG: hypothetical protein HC851_24005, partial [Acaryochloris sp. RU_4_1]|nr:hypothetical protein [Acaryochloris sp. RU_4_1]